MSGSWILSLTLGVAAYEFWKRDKRITATVFCVGSIVFTVVDLM